MGADAPPLTHADGPGCWHDLRGRAERVGDLRAFFIAAHAAAAAAAAGRGAAAAAAFDEASAVVVRAYVPTLLEGIHSHIFHGVIDLAYSIEARCVCGIADVSAVLACFSAQRVCVCATRW